MASGDKIVVKYHNVRVQNLTTAMMKETVYVSVRADGDEYPPSTLTDIKVAVPARSTIVMDPPRSDVGSIEESVRVIYTAKDVIPSNPIVVNLPEDWGPAYMNDGSAGDGSFGEISVGEDIDLGAALKMVSSMDEAATEPASYVTVTYDRRGSSSNTAVVTIVSNRVTVEVAGEMASGDKIVKRRQNRCQIS
jgi:hypothetical protein